MVHLPTHVILPDSNTCIICTGSQKVSYLEYTFIAREVSVLDLLLEKVS